MKANLFDGGLDVIEAIDGKDLVCPAIFEKDGVGTYACLLSHIKAIEYAKENGWDCVCIFEDDILFKPNFNTELRRAMALLPKDWDMLWLAGTDIQPSLPKNEYLCKLYSCYGAYGYILRDTMYEFLLKELKKLELPVDDVYARVQNRFRSFKLKNKLVSHIGKISDRNNTRIGKLQEVSKYEIDSNWFTEGRENLIVSIYLTGAKHRTPTFPVKANIKQLEAWAKSIKTAGLAGLVYHNCFTETDIISFAEYPVTFSYADLPKGYNSGLYRFELYDNLIKKFGKYIDNAFFTDSTDLEVLRNPFIDSKYESSKIYIGCEPTSPVGNKWIMEHSHDFPQYIDLVKSNIEFANHKLLNAGLCGGNIKTITLFMNRMAEECNKMEINPHFQDMPIINYLAFTEFKEQVYYGSQLNTVFTGYEKNNKIAYFRHK